MNIKNIRHYKDSFWDWTPFNTAFGDSNIRISDMDGHVEHNGYHLFIETKSPGAKMPRGQEIANCSLSDDYGHTLVCVWGENNQTEAITIRRHGVEREIRCADNGRLKDLLSWWYRSAHRHAFQWPEKPILNPGRLHFKNEPPF